MPGAQSARNRIVWGYGRTWKVIDPPLHSSSLTVMCSIKHLQDVLPGESQKHCQCQGQVMSKHSFSSESTAFTEGGISKTLGTCMLPCQLCYFLFFFLVQLPN
eukprot:g11699.t1